MKSSKKVVNVHEAKTHLSRLLERVEAGEEVTIAKAGRPVAGLVPILDTSWKRPLGMDKGLVWIARGASFVCQSPRPGTCPHGLNRYGFCRCQSSSLTRCTSWNCRRIIAIPSTDFSSRRRRWRTSRF